MRFIQRRLQLCIREKSNLQNTSTVFSCFFDDCFALLFCQLQDRKNMNFLCGELEVYFVHRASLFFLKVLHWIQVIVKF